jgi:hypothetical protein
MRAIELRRDQPEHVNHPHHENQNGNRRQPSRVALQVS